MSLQSPTDVRNRTFASVTKTTEAIVPPHLAWQNLSLATGYPGILILLTRLEERGLIEEGPAHAYVLAIKESIETEGLWDLSLFSGVAGLCFALEIASSERTRYLQMLTVLQNFLIERVRTHYARLTGSRLYDTICGLAGVGVYLLSDLSMKGCAQLVRDIAERLIGLSQPIDVQGHLVPGWHLLADDPLNGHRDCDPGGNFNLGLAHGIPGVLVFLAQALIRGIKVKGQQEAMERMIDWIQAAAYSDGRVTYWPYSISWSQQIGGECETQMTRDAWCYGTPGVARALFIAGRALGDTSLKGYAQKAFASIFLRDREEWNLPGPMLCHGLAGLMTVTQAMELPDQAHQLRETILAEYDPNSTYGFSDVDAGRKSSTVRLDRVGFLDGVAGLTLAIDSLISGNTSWRLPFLIDE